VTGRPVVVASNRGPVSFVRDPVSGEVSARRGAGGLVTALGGALRIAGGTWIAAAMSDEDRAHALRGGADLDDAGFRLRSLAFDPVRYDDFYNSISNGVLWFTHHLLWEPARTPRFDERTFSAWESYRAVNAGFADALAEAGDDPAFLVQDYHLALVPAMLRERVPSARIAHFSHIPFAAPGFFRILPQRIRTEVLRGLLGANVLGFQARMWADNFLLCCRDLDGARVNLTRRTIRWEGREVRVRINPISIEVEPLREVARSPEVANRKRRIARSRGDRRLLLRVDRAELSKNILRGFLAYELFLRRHPEWRGRVVFLALLNPSREAIPEYRTYLDECLEIVGRINEEFGDRHRMPIVTSVKDDFPLSVAAYTMYDALMVNPVLDGMNLVAKEGPILNRRRGALILSTNAGAFDELGRHAIPVDPFDLLDQAEAIRRALEMPADERARRARGLRAAVRRNPLDRWVRSQLDDLERT